MFGMGPGYAHLLRPDDALREERMKKKKRSEVEEVPLDTPSGSYSNNNNKDSIMYAGKTFEGQNTVVVIPCSPVDDEESQQQQLSGVQKEWKKVFQKLDIADGTSDGKIDRKALVKWVSALDLQKTIEFETNLNITPWYVSYTISNRTDQTSKIVKQVQD